jgi:hypothetical protein
VAGAALGPARWRRGIAAPGSGPPRYSSVGVTSRLWDQLLLTRTSRSSPGRRCHARGRILSGGAKRHPARAVGRVIAVDELDVRVRDDVVYRRARWLALCGSRGPLLHEIGDHLLERLVAFVLPNRPSGVCWPHASAFRVSSART